MDLTVGTFNLNNLFDRFNFQADLGALPLRDLGVETTFMWVYAGQGVGPNDPPPQLVTDQSSTPVVRVQLNAHGTLISPKPPNDQASIGSRVDAMNVDVLAVQEVENIDALRRFNRSRLANPYPYEVLIEGNDPRYIDVGLLSRYPVVNLTSHRFEEHDSQPGMPVFGRDLLEVDLYNQTRTKKLLTIFVNHLKSNFVQFNDPDPDATRDKNNRRRTRQAEVVSRVVNRQTRAGSRFVVLGDMNDATDAATLDPMVSGVGLIDGLVNVTESQPPPHSTNVEDVPQTIRWTHRFPMANAPDKYELFDQIWVSEGLDGMVAEARIERRPKWNASSQGVGSDHDPVWVRLTGL